jgi:pimeloyl-ACP methyl ester carboxylesterase
MLDMLGDHWLLILAVFVGLAALWIVAVLSKYVRLMLNIIRDTPSFLLINPIDYEPVEGSRVNFRAFDGTLLQGMYVRADFPSPSAAEEIASQYTQGTDRNGRYFTPDSRGVIIFCHEYGSDMHSWARYGNVLRKAGFDIFTFDFRSHGQSGRLYEYEPRFWCTDKEVSDCLGALALVQTQLEEEKRDLPIGFLGISRGGCAALMTAAAVGKDSSLKAVLTDGAFSTDTLLELFMKRWVHIFARVRFVYENHHRRFWHFLRWLLLKFARIRFHCRFPSVRKNLRRIKHQAVFFIHGQKDSYIPQEQARRLYELSSLPRYLWIVPDAKHNQSVAADATLYNALTVGFFERYLASSSMENSRIPEPYREKVNALFGREESVISSTLFEEALEYVDTGDSILGGAARQASAEDVRAVSGTVPQSSASTSAKHLANQPGK